MYHWQIEDLKIREVEIAEEMKVLVSDKFEVLGKLEGLAGLPEKLVKQVKHKQYLAPMGP